MGAEPQWIDPTKLSRPTVIVLMLADCPIARKFAPEIGRLHSQYKGRVDFYLAISDPDVTAKDAAEFKKAYGFQMPVLRDPGLKLARKYKADKTPTAVLLSKSGKVAYQGWIDDRFPELGKQRPAPTRRELKDALDAVLAGKRPKVAKAPVVGCFLPL